MLISKKGALAVSLAATSAIALAACGSSSKGGSSNASKAPAAFTLNNGPTGGTAGGTLKVVSQGDVSNFDSESMYDTASYSLARLFVRGLYGYKSGNNQADRLGVTPDLADGQPQISSDGLSYTIKIQKGVDWNIDGTGRQVTAADAIRGLKMTCNPVLPFGATYYQQSIAGLSSFCDGFAKVSQSDAGAIKSYVESTQVSGLQAVDDTTLKITLTSKFADFMHFLALPSASPVNIEQLQYVPDSNDYRQHTYADGPYRITAYTPNKSITLVRNPVWQASTDQLRKAYVDNISIDEGGDTDTILQQIQAGTADTTFSNDPLPTTAIPGLISSGDTGLHVNPTGGTNPYLVFNQTEAAGSPTTKLQVRQALNYAANKQAISQVLGGPRINPVINQIFSQSVVGAGWTQQDVYSTPNNAGDAAKAKSLLTEAGYPNGVTLKFSYRTLGNGPKIADSLKTSLAAAGINLTLKGVVNSNYYGNYLQKSSITKTGDWDIAEPGWSADWEGSSERSYFTPLFDGREYTKVNGEGSTNYGDFNDDAVNTAADAALAEQDPAKAAADWDKIDAQIMHDAPWVPLVENNQANYVGKRVKNFQFYYPGSGVDLANLAVQ